MSRGRYLFSDRVRLCTAQIACDGACLIGNRQMCGKCEAAQKKRARQTALRGKQFMDFQIKRNRSG